MDLKHPNKLQNRTIKANRHTFAAKWNAKFFEGLREAIRRDPEVDLTTLITANYRDKLLHHKEHPARLAPSGGRKPFSHSSDIRSIIAPSGQAHVVSELSPELPELLATHGNSRDGDTSGSPPGSGSDGGGPSDDDAEAGGDDDAEGDGDDLDDGSGDDADGDDARLWDAVVRLLDDGVTLYTGATALTVMVLRVSETIVAKISVEEYMRNEFQALLYLEKHLPTFPVPRLHGLVRLDKKYVLFTSLIPGRNLEMAWPLLGDAQKRSISRQLDALWMQLRASLPHPKGTPLGGVGGEGCKDYRRWPRHSNRPIFTVEQFEDFIFAGTWKSISPMFVEFLRSFKPSEPTSIVFTHGDLRPANIMVDVDDGAWKVVAIVDWDTSGFYPEYWEALKMTNNLSPLGGSDWYKYLPASVSPHRYSTHWLLDRVLDRNLEHS